MHTKIEALRGLETFGYQVAYYLLRDEGLSIEATAAAMEELYPNDRFFRCPLPERRDWMKRVIAKKALTIKRTSLRASG